MYSINQLQSDYFGNLGTMGNFVNYLFKIDQRRFLLQICILIGVKFHLSRDRI